MDERRAAAELEARAPASAQASAQAKIPGAGAGDHGPENVAVRPIRMLVTGGTGVLGRVLVPALAASGYQVRSASRRPPRRGSEADATGCWVHLDLETGAGLEQALESVDVVIHAASSPFRRTHRIDVEGTRQLLDRARTAGVSHVIYVSIVGIERVPFTYYRCKVAAERLVEQSGVPWTILRATQFPQLIENLLLRPATYLPVMLLPTDFRFQPIDPDIVAGRLVQCVADGPAGRLPDLAGPEVLTVGEMARAWLAARGLRRRIIHLPLPGKLAAAYRSGAVTAPLRPTPGSTWADWVQQTQGQPAATPEG